MPAAHAEMTYMEVMRHARQRDQLANGVQIQELAFELLELKQYVSWSKKLRTDKNVYILYVTGTTWRLARSRSHVMGLSPLPGKETNTQVKNHT